MAQKSAFITLLGRPNVGKSSLLNKIVGQKVAIVSDKPQTTRTRIMGVVTKGENQFVFIDTPGFHKPHNLLGNSMIKAVDTGMSDVDGAVLRDVPFGSTLKNVGQVITHCACLCIINIIKAHLVHVLLVREEEHIHFIGRLRLAKHTVTLFELVF